MATMEFHKAHLQHGATISRDDCCVRSDAQLMSVLQKSATGGQPFLFVEDEDGYPMGVLSAEDILRRVTCRDHNELTRWMNMSVESVLESRIQIPESTSRSSDTTETHCTKVSKDGVLVGVITENDVLVSWRSIQRTLQHAHGDAVTGLPNRAAFNNHLQTECNRARRCGHSVAVVLIDLDYFKSINDQFGHAAGDAALNVVGTTLRKSLRSYDLVARFGGDEFAVICCGCRPGEIDHVVHRLESGMRQLNEDPSIPRPIPTLSIGAAVAHDLSLMEDPLEIVQAADQSLYDAKRHGRDCAFKCELGLRGPVQSVKVVAADAPRVGSQRLPEAAAPVRKLEPPAPSFRFPADRISPPSAIPEQPA